jgi:superfamily II DNA or RNA helicase/intein/homing endonuclease
MTVIDLYNGYIKVSSPSDELREYLSGLLYYQDKSKRYQLKKMSKNPFLRASKAYEKLQKESEGNLLEVDGENILVPPGLSDVFKDYQVNDLRTETGTEISLPWKDSQSAIKLRDFQQEAVDIAKCHAKGQLILMFDGSLKPVEEIIVGDLVMGPDSKPRRVLSLTSGFGPMFKITPIKGCSFTVNGDHLLSLRRSYSSLKRSSGKTKHKDRIIDEEIVNISVLEYLKQGQAFKHKYKLYRSNAIDFYEKDLLIDPYILGLWLGDGLSRDSTVVSVDNEIVDSLYSFAKLNELNIRKYEDNITYRLGGNTGLIGSNLFLTALKQLNLLCNKHIPENYKSSSIEQRLQLLAGLIDTDGHYSSGLFDITQKNKKIAEDIVFIARSLGLAAYMKERLKVATNSKEKIKKVYYSVTISGNIDKIPTRVLRKQAPCRKQIKNVLNIGFKVERVNDDSFYGFTVDSDNLYLLSDFTVTHNCNYRGIINFATGLGKTKTAICLIREIKRKTLVVCPSKSIAKQFKEELEERFGSRRVGFIGDGTFKPADITVGIAATVNNNIEKIKTWGLGLIVFDECFPYRENISTEDGPKEIGWLVKQWENNQVLPRVLSWNEKSKKFEYKKITYAWRKERSDLVEVKYSKRKFRCTPNHKVLTQDGWKEAGSLCKGDKLLGFSGFKQEKHVISLHNEDQKDFIIGSFLGDGHIANAGLNRYRLSITHGAQQTEYATWKSQLINGSVNTILKNGYSEKKAVRVVSKSFDLDFNLPSKKTYCPNEVIESINAKSLAIWFMDDGSVIKNGSGARIATCSFDYDSNVRLSCKLNSMGVENKVVFVKYTGKRAPGYYELFISKNGYNKMAKIIAPYIHKSMSYKVPGYKCGTYQWNNQFQTCGYGLVDSIKLVNNKVQKGRKPYVFDIEVEDNHNFVVCSRNGEGGIIAHNCHHTPATTFYSIAKDLGDTGRIYGLTATSYRSDGKDIFIQAGCGSILIERDIKWGVDNGWLAKPYFLVRKIDTGDSDPFPDDKLKSYKTHVLNNKEMTVRIEKDALAMISAGKSTLILVDQVEHGELLAKVLKVPFAHGDDKQSEEYIANLNKGKIKGLVATEGKAGEGVDTRNVDCLILANFAGSKGIVIQAVGRGLRKQGTKENCIILDYIPSGSIMLKRHAQNRIQWYQEITDNVKIL